MDKTELVAYRRRWEAVESIEREELRRMTIRQRWRMLNSVYGLAKAAGISILPDISEQDIYQLWAKLRIPGSLRKK